MHFKMMNLCQILVVVALFISSLTANPVHAGICKGNNKHCINKKIANGKNFRIKFADHSFGYFNVQALGELRDFAEECNASRREMVDIEFSNVDVKIVSMSLSDDNAVTLDDLVVSGSYNLECMTSHKFEFHVRNVKVDRDCSVVDEIGFNVIADFVGTSDRFQRCVQSIPEFVVRKAYDVCTAIFKHHAV